MTVSELTFYTNPRSRARIVRWILEEVGVPYETKMIDLSESTRPPELVAINPMGKVPAILHNGHAVTEAAAICAYLADAFPDAGLKPTNAHLGAYYRWLFFTSGPLEAAINDRLLGFDVPQKYETAVGYGNYDHAVAALKDHVAAHEFVAGPTFSAADVYVGSHVLFSLISKAIEKHQAFIDYVRRITDRDGFRRVGELDGPIDEP